MNEILRRIAESRIVPVITPRSADGVVNALQNLMKNGYRCAEITFRTAAAADALSGAVLKFQDMTLGAGTVLSAEQAEIAVRRGARFIMSPGFNAEAADCCARHGVLYIPGCATPTEMENLIRLGFSVVKVFPAASLGGTGFLRAVSAVYPDLKFIPTGGITADTAREYLSLDSVLAVGGSWMTG